jgi:hypothetical protein
MVASSVLLRSILPSITLNFIIQLVVFYLIIIAIYRYNVISCILGYVLSIAIYIMSEALLALVMNLFSMSVEDIYSSDIIRVLASIPERVVQIFSIVVICKLRNINLRVEKLPLKDFMSIVFFCGMIISSMISIESGILSKNNGIYIKCNLVINIFVAFVLCSWLIYSIFKLRKKLHIKENIYDVELHHIKQLLEEGQADHAIELIDLTLRDRGYYEK